MKEFIQKTLESCLGSDYQTIFDNSPLLYYLDSKMGAVYGNSKTRRSLANIYAIYSLTYFYHEDFYNKPEEYKQFEGYEYTKLFNFYRGLYGGEKLQNHALNSRVNGEFRNKARGATVDPIVINNGKYALHIQYLYVHGIDISGAINAVVEKYIELLYEKDHTLSVELGRLEEEKSTSKKLEIVNNLLTETAEARIFEIVSYVILRRHFGSQTIFFGFSRDAITEVSLELYKTGRTNANDGGIDFVMKPLGRFFQVTEVGNYDKYFLDIDKVMHFPITFVIKTTKSKAEIEKEFDAYIAEKSGGMEVISRRYRDALEDIITINELSKWLFDLSPEDVDRMIVDMRLYYDLEMNLIEGSVLYGTSGLEDS